MILKSILFYKDFTIEWPVLSKTVLTLGSDTSLTGDVHFTLLLNVMKH